MKKLLLSAVIICSVAGYGQQQGLAWVKSVGNNIGISGVTSSCIETDASGNILISGTFDADTDFDPSDNTLLLTTEYATGFVAKYDSNGLLLWAKKFEASAVSYAGNIATDTAGNIYITGKFGGNFDADPGAGVYMLNTLTQPYNALDTFIVKLDAEGDFVWAKEIDTLPGDIFDTRSVYTDAEGSLYMCGTLGSEIDADPGMNVFMLLPVGDYDAYILKLDSTGNFEWAQSFGSAGNIVGAYSLSGSNGYVYLGGGMRGNVDFDFSTGTAILNGTDDIFYEGYILKLSVDGDYIWAKKFDSTSGFNNIINSLVCDSGGNVYAGGHFEAATDFDPNEGEAVLEPVAIDMIQMFVCRINTDGTFGWVRSATENGGGSNLWSLTADGLDNIYAAGNFTVSINFSENAATITNDTETENFFITRLTTQGEFMWQKAVSISQNYGFPYMSADTNGNLYVTGAYVGELQFSDDSNYDMVNDGAAKMFIARYNSSTLAAQIPEATKDIVLYPNPSNGTVYIKDQNNFYGADISVYNQLGQQVYIFKLDKPELSVNLAQGIYMVKLVKGGKTYSEKLIIR